MVVGLFLFSRHTKVVFARRTAWLSRHALTGRLLVQTCHVLHDLLLALGPLALLLHQAKLIDVFRIDILLADTLFVFLLLLRLTHHQDPLH